MQGQMKAAGVGQCQSLLNGKEPRMIERYPRPSTPGAGEVWHRCYGLLAHARRQHDWRRLGSMLLFVVAAQLVAACDTPSAALAPVETEQIKNVVEDYYVRNSSIPDQEVEIQEVTGNWARVSIKPAGVETEPDLFFLQNQATAVNDVPAVQPTVLPGNQAPVTTTSGWTIILGPQVQFTEEELDAAGIPAEIRQ